MMTRSLGLQAWVASNSVSDIASTTSISLTTTGGSAGGPSHVAVCRKGCPFLWRRRWASHTFWYRFQRRTLRRGPVSDRFWYGFDWRSFNVHFCLTLQSNTCFAFSEGRKRLRLNKFTTRVRENNLTIHIRIRERNIHHRHNRRRGRQTQRKTQGIPSTLHLRKGTEKLEYFGRQTNGTNSFTVKIKPFPFFLHLSLPTFTHFFIGFLVHPPPFSLL